MTTSAEGRWTGRPWLGGALTAAVFALPVAASAAAAVIVSHLVARPASGNGRVWWWATIMASSTIVLLGADRLTRRLLPLAGLLKMTMVFPDVAPSRLAVARRAGSTRELERRIEHAHHHGINEEPVKAAEEILSLAAALSAHDRRTRGHSERVRVLTDLIARDLKLSSFERDRLRWSALLHDIGKLAVHPDILNTPSKPSAEEWEKLRQHPLEGSKLAAPLLPWLGEWALAIEQHHEKYDGSGYPYGLAGRNISLAARVVAVADVFETMTARRSYKDAVSPKRARAELTRCAGTHFDPAIVRSFLSIPIGRLRWIIGPISWLAQIPLVGAETTGAMAAVAGKAALGAAALSVGTFVASPVLASAPPTAISAPAPAQLTAQMSESIARTAPVDVFLPPAPAADPPPVDPVPVDPVVDPVPVDDAVDPAPAADPVPVADPAPVDAGVDPVPVDPMVDPVAVDPVPVDPVPVDPAPVDASPPSDPAADGIPMADPVPVDASAPLTPESQ